MKPSLYKDWNNPLAQFLMVVIIKTIADLAVCSIITLSPLKWKKYLFEIKWIQLLRILCSITKHNVLQTILWINKNQSLWLTQIYQNHKYLIPY